jgi:peptidyl-prolyl cis-trans isomerase C
MATVINTKTDGSAVGLVGDGYSTYKEPDTKIPPKAKPVLNEVTVNGVEIKEADILAEAQNHSATNPGEALLEAARALVIRELLWQEAKTQNLDFKPILDENNRMETEQDAAIRVLIEAEVDVPYASEDECRRYYEQNPQRCMSETISEARHILIPAAPDDKGVRETARAKADELISILEDKPEDFGDLAKEFSACPSSKQGGNLGQLTKGSTVSEFEKAIDIMDVGSISKSPIESRFGFHIIALDRKTPGEVLPFEAMQVRLKAWLEAASWSKAVAQYIAILAGKSKVTGVSLSSADSPLVQ